MKKVILTIDGGGVRGYMEAKILAYIEKRMRIHEDSSTLHLAKYVDMISGASTGGIIAALLTCPNDKGKYKFDCSDIVGFYEQYCYKIFNESKRRLPLGGLVDSNKYKVSNLESILDKYFGDIQLNSLLNYVLIPTLDLQTSEAVFFSNHRLDTELTTYRVKDVLRATSAAPTYFEPKVLNTANNKAKVIGIDGGMVANNTSICAISEMQEYSETDIEDIVLINIGSGSVNPYLGNMEKEWGLIRWIKQITNVMLYANVGLVGYQLKHFRLGKLWEIDIPGYLRVYDKDMADASPENMQLLKAAAESTIYTNRKILDEIAMFLINNNKK